MIKDAFSRLDQYCKENDFRGWDVFDGLNSRLFTKSPFYYSAFFRLAWIQFFKRSPVNVRKIALVPQDYNPKGLGLFCSGLTFLRRLDEAGKMLKCLKGMTCNGYRGVSWGYNFPWQARAFYVPLGTPNMVTTVFVTQAFLDYFETTNKDRYLEFGKEACVFILDNLILFEDQHDLCFGYIPGEGARVHNANMLGAALLARIYRYTRNQAYLEKSRKSMNYSMNALTPEYHWPYGELGHHRFVDNFHTGFNLVALKEWMDHTGDRYWEDPLKKAYQSFLDTFWLENGAPKYYHNQLYPIDIHCSAQGIVTCIKLAEYDQRSIPLAHKIAKWAIENMQDKKGYFYYQKTRWYTNKIPYIRWAQAWMYYALALFLSSKKTEGRSAIT